MAGPSTEDLRRIRLALLNPPQKPDMRLAVAALLPSWLILIRVVLLAVDGAAPSPFDVASAVLAVVAIGVTFARMTDVDRHRSLVQWQVLALLSDWIREREHADQL
jgi:hypothetical protein